MFAATRLILSGFARDVADGLSRAGQKQISSRYFYDDLGSALFEAITLLPEYGLTRADERILQTHAADLAETAGRIGAICELGSGSGKKTRYLLQALGRENSDLIYHPIDVSPAALAVCERELGDLAEVRPVCAEWIDGLRQIAAVRTEAPLLVLFLGSTIGNIERSCIPEFLQRIRAALRPGDLFLIGADLVKDIDTMLMAYDDPTGVTAAFNLNILNRVNRELDGDFDLRAFAHQVCWNSQERRIEMHLASSRKQTVCIGALDSAVHFEAGETIWTESSHKFSHSELLNFARSSGFASLEMWTDPEWPFAEALWTVSGR